jgi:hypothetical protein
MIGEECALHARGSTRKLLGRVDEESRNHEGGPRSFAVWIRVSAVSGTMKIFSSSCLHVKLTASAGPETRHAIGGEPRENRHERDVVAIAADEYAVQKQGACDWREH